MAIAVCCPICNEHYAVADSLAGKKVCCRNCRATIAVPVPTQNPPAQPIVATSSRLPLKWLIAAGLAAGILIVCFGARGWFVRPVGPPLNPKNPTENLETRVAQKKPPELIPLNAPLNAIVKGRVHYDGTPPPAEFIEYRQHKDAKECLSGSHNEKVNQTWLVVKDGAVANVVISLRPQKGFRFNLPREATKRSDVVVMETPHCAFVPHVVALFPEFVDETGKRQRTGQVFKVRNSGSLLHNVKSDCEEPRAATFSETLAPGKERTFLVELQEDPIHLGCTFHPWMTAYALSFDNPYAAVTGEDGQFEIKNAPSGVELQVVVWHEAFPIVQNTGGMPWLNRV